MEHTLNKPWMDGWIMSLRGLPANEQAIGLWMGYLANEKGEIENIDWEKLGELAGMFFETPKKILRRDDCELLERGLLRKEDRMVNDRYYLTPRFILSVPKLEEVST